VEQQSAAKKGFSLRGSLILVALGVVFGDIGTSPLYALRECFSPENGLAVTRDNVLGVVSLVFWSLVLVVFAKYVLLVLRADNRGEGGILSLITLVGQGKERGSKRYGALIVLGMLGAALLYGDSVITPAISVLSAIEGLNVATNQAQDYVIPLTVVVLLCLFLLQRRGTAAVGSLFGPVILVWFATIAVLGMRAIVSHPAVLQAVLPSYAVAFFLENGRHGFWILGFVFLALTGAEMLYADLGHFGTAPITRAWLFIVFPALLLNYFGQGAYLLANPTGVENLFYRLAPSWMLYPLVILATMATVVASQAVISGAFSMARQAMQLGFWPRMQVIHTSSSKMGQVYLPFVNWALLVGTVVLVLAFRKSGNLASAYGIAVSTQMLITTGLIAVIIRKIWKIESSLIFLVPLLFMVVDLAFFGSNVIKIFKGGWIVLLVAGALFIMMATWRKGRALLAGQAADDAIGVEAFIADVNKRKPTRVPGIAVFFSSDPSGTPRALLHNYKHNTVIHDRNVILSVRTEEHPFVSITDRLQIENLGSGFYRAIVRYGFSETPDVPASLKLAPESEIKFEPIQTTFFLGRESLVFTRRRTMASWRKSLFGHMSRNALDATRFFQLPVNRVVELGLQVEL
ncbi:MAG: potassium transporter Kup, partial [bacterium]